MTGVVSCALSGVDLALWDLRGKRSANRRGRALGGFSASVPTTLILSQACPNTTPTSWSGRSTRHLSRLRPSEDGRRPPARPRGSLITPPTSSVLARARARAVGLAAGS